MRDRLRELNGELERDFGVTVSMRIGVNTGEVVVGTGAQTLATGDAVNVAARLEQAADPGGILLGGDTYGLVRDAVTAAAVDPVEAKGKAEPVVAFRLEAVTGTEGVARRFDTPIVGRGNELDALADALRRSTRDRACALVTVLGPAGVGKSRLILEFLQRAREAVRAIHGACLAYGEGITYWPVVEMLTEAAGIAEADGPDAVRAKVGALLTDDPEAAAIAERLQPLLGLPGQTATVEDTHRAVRKVLERLATDAPLVAVVDDIHWAEPALLDLLEHVADWSRDAPILLLCSARPELLDARPSWGGGKLNATTFLLEPLSGPESDELISNLLTRADLTEDARRRIREAGEGNPLFVEQLVAMLIDDGSLVREGDRWIATRDPGELAVPASISALLQARLDRLSPDERAAIERASVEGKVFHVGGVVALSAPDDAPRVREHLLSLVRRDLIRPERATLAGEDAFRFRHQLIRDAAYQQMPKERRAELHEAFAAWMSEVAGERAAELQEILAYHLERAYLLRAELGPVDERGQALAAAAAEQLIGAGGRASARGDKAATANLLGRAARLLDPDDPIRADVLVRLAEARFERGEADAAMADLREALALAEANGDRRTAIAARLEEITVRMSVAPEGTAEELEREAQAAIPYLESVGDDEGLVRAWTALAMVAQMRGLAVAGEAAALRSGIHAERAGDRVGVARAVESAAMEKVLGRTRPEDAIPWSRDTRARHPGDRWIEAWTLICEGLFEAMSGRIDLGREIHDRGRAILADLGSALFHAATTFGNALIEEWADDPDARERVLQQGFERLRAFGDQGYLSSHAVSLSQVFLDRGRLDEAEEMSRVAEEAGSTEDMAAEVGWRSTRARILARRGDLAGASRLADEALAMAESVDLVDTIVDAALAAAEVRRAAGRPEEALEQLRRAHAVMDAKGNVVMRDRIGGWIEAWSSSA
jgi:tetratricopeptide (TPR) repeat protein